MEFSAELGDMDIVQKAQVYAMAAHASVKQLRKYTNEPYIVHPMEVASIVATVPGATKDMLAAAILHDVIEDTGCTFTDIHMAFGIDIAGMVSWLTDVSKPEDGNRAARKAIDLAHTAQAPAYVKTIKLADIISNCKSIMEYDPNFAKIYLEEKRAQLAVLTEGDPELLARAREIVGVA
jgi:(p)ppGpp synthase/HD superfamily hydrolase